MKNSSIRALLPALLLLTTPIVAQTLAPASTASTTAATASWHPQLYFGGVNYHEQFADNPQGWEKTIARADGMLLHLHFWVRDLNTPDNAKVANADEIKRKIAPQLKNKANIAELTYHIRDAKSSPEAIGRDHAAQVERL